MASYARACLLPPSPERRWASGELNGSDLGSTIAGRQSNTIGILVTKTFMIAGEPELFTTPNGTQGAMLRAYDEMEA